MCRVRPLDGGFPGAQHKALADHLDFSALCQAANFWDTPSKAIGIQFEELDKICLADGKGKYKRITRKVTPSWARVAPSFDASSPPGCCPQSNEILLNKGMKY